MPLTNVTVSLKRAVSELQIVTGKHYKDGSLSQSDSISGTINVPTANSKVGYSTSAYAEMNLEKVGMWTRALSAEEVTSIYDSGSSKTYEDLTTSEKVSLEVFYSCNQVSGDLIDEHTSGKDLTDSGGVGTALSNVVELADLTDRVYRISDSSKNFEQATEANQPIYNSYGLLCTKDYLTLTSSGMIPYRGSDDASWSFEGWFYFDDLVTHDDRDWETKDQNYYK